jgi:cell division protein FtsQ
MGSILFALVMITAAMAEKEEQKVCKNMVIKTNTDNEPGFLNKSDVKELLYKAFQDSIMRKPLDLIPVSEVEKVLTDNPYVANAHVFIDMNESLHINIVQRMPVMRIINKYNVHYYIDENANKIPLNNKFTCRVPVVTGHIMEGYDKGGKISSKELQNIFNVMNIIAEDSFWSAQIEQVEIQEDGSMHLIPKIGNHVIIMDKGTDVDVALDKLLIFYHEGLPYTGWDKYSSINLSYKGQIVCTKKIVQ